MGKRSASDKLPKGKGERLEIHREVKKKRKLKKTENMKKYKSRAAKNAPNLANGCGVIDEKFGQDGAAPGGVQETKVKEPTSQMVRSTVFDAIKTLDISSEAVKGRGIIEVVGCPQSTIVLQLSLLLAAKGIPFERQRYASRDRRGDDVLGLADDGEDFADAGSGIDAAVAACAASLMDVPDAMGYAVCLMHGDVVLRDHVVAMQYIEMALSPKKPLMRCPDRRLVKKRWESIAAVMSKVARLPVEEAAAADDASVAEHPAVDCKALARTLDLKALDAHLGASTSNEEASPAAEKEGTAKRVAKRVAKGGKFLSGSATPDLMDYVFFPLIAEALGRGVRGKTSSGVTGAAEGAEGTPVQAGAALASWQARMEEKIVVQTTLAAVVEDAERIKSQS